VLQEYAAPAEAVSCTLPLGQKVVGPPAVIVAVGVETAMVFVACAMQYWPSYARTLSTTALPEPSAE
jgi:hypothetical protein